MTLNLQAQSGFRRDSMWCGPAAHAVMPSPAERNERGACTSFGRVLKAADITSVRPGSARCGIAQPCLTLSGQRSKRGAPYGVSCGRERDTAYRPVSAYNTAPHYPRHHGNPCAEKVRPHRPRQNKPAVRCEYPDDVGAPCQQWHSAGANRQGTLTITGSNVRLGTEMPVALPHFLKSQISNLQ
jgi:hypothetical protein